MRCSVPRQAVALIASPASCTIGMSACSGAHDWARRWATPCGSRHRSSLRRTASGRCGKRRHHDLQRRVSQGVRSKRYNVYSCRALLTSAAPCRLTWPPAPSRRAPRHLDRPTGLHGRQPHPKWRAPPRPLPSPFGRSAVAAKDRYEFQGLLEGDFSIRTHGHSRTLPDPLRAT